MLMRQKIEFLLLVSLAFSSVGWAQAVINPPDPQVSIWYNASGWEIRLSHSATVSDPNGAAPDNATYWAPYIQVARDAGFTDLPLLWPYGGGGWTAQTPSACGASAIPPSLVTNQPSNLVVSGSCGTTTGVGYPDWRVYGLAPGQTYYVRCIGCLSIDTTGDCGSVPERYDTYVGSAVPVTTPMLPPAATTQPATGVSASGATLNATVNANNIDTSHWFEWGPTVTYGNTTPPGAIPAGVGPSSWTEQSVSAPISGLTAGQTYHFRAVGQSAAGTSYGADRTFVALALPDVTTGPATGITSSSAVLNGTINPRGVSTSWCFDVGLASGVYTWTTAGGIITGTGDKAVTISLAGLTPATPYYYRLRGDSANGAVYGAELAFATLGEPAPVLPTLTTEAPTSVSYTSAILNAIVNPMGSATTYYFEMGLTPGGPYPTSSSVGNAGSGTADVWLSRSVSGLLQGTRYYYRAAGANAAGTAYGAENYFDTLSAPPGAPIAVTLDPDAIGSTSATLRGTYDTQGLAGSAWFEWGPSPALGELTAAQPTNSDNETAYSRRLAGLAPSTDYYVRAVVQTTNGIAYGSILPFRTDVPSVQYREDFDFECAWVEIRNPALINGSGKRGTARKSVATLRFTGSGVSLYSIRDKTLGKMRVTIDGSRASTAFRAIDSDGALAEVTPTAKRKARSTIVDLYTPGATQFQARVYQVTGLAAGTHTLRCEVYTPKRTKRRAIFVDAAEVMP